MQRALDDERKAEGHQQTVQRIEPVQTAEEQPFNDDTEQADRQRREQQGGTVIDSEQLQPEEGGERTQGIKGAVGEVDDAHQAEYHREPEAEQSVERSVYEAEHQLPGYDCHGNAEDFAHGVPYSGR